MTEAAAPRVLLVDDDPSMRLTMKTLLEANGFDVAGEAEDGEAGEQAYAEVKPDLVLLDVDMPKKMGVEALRGILASDPDAKVIMLTSIDAVGVIDDAITIGAKDYLRKDADLQSIPERLKKIVG